jgi:hypothetical protein
MTISEFTLHLKSNSAAELRFLLPDGGLIPAHAHVTEVGRVDKRFVDCGGTRREHASCLLQTWVADDIDHRLTPEKLATIIASASELLQDPDLPVEIEYEDFLVSQFPVAAVEAKGNTITFALVTKHTDCLAKERCMPPVAPEGEGCATGERCC